MPTPCLSLEGWLWEILCWLVSVGCVVVIAITLRYYDGRTVPQWRYGITLNSIIAICSTVAKVTLMTPVTECLSQLKWTWFAEKERSLWDFQTFDEASRGEWGSLMFLIRRKKALSPSLCALLTIAALATSTLTQQAVTYLPRMAPSGNATIPRSSTYRRNRTSLVSETADSRNREGGLGIKTAVYTGLWTSFAKEVQPVPPVCRTGNCRFPTYYSLGVCAQMADVSAQLTNKNDNESTSSSYIRTLPNGAFLAIPPMSVSAINISSPYPVRDRSGTLTFQNVSRDAIITNKFVIIDYSRGKGTNTSAVELLLKFCVREYNTSVHNGQVATQEKAFDLQTAPRQVNGSYTFPPINTSRQVLTGSFLDGVPTTDVAELFAQAIYKPPQDFSNLFRILKNIATSMTNSICVDNGDGESVVGTEYSMETYVHVRLYWLTFLASLVLASGMLLVSTMVETRRTRTAIWKSSSLAALYALDSHVRETQRLETERDMSSRSRKVNAKLYRENDNQWHLTIRK